MKKKLAIICANQEQLPLVKKANEMGIETHCFAWDKEGFTHCKGIVDYFHPISILDKEQILKVCREIKIDGVTSIMNDFAVPTVAYVAENMGLPGNRYEDTFISANKFKARQTFYKNGVHSPLFAIVPEEKVPDLTGFTYPLIVKPNDRAGAIGVSKIETENELREAFQKAHEASYNGEVIIEEFITGSEVSVDTISYNGEHYVMAIKEREMIIEKDGHPRKIAGHFPFELPADIRENIKIETLKALDAINYKYGASNTEFRLTDAGEVFIMEVNPRMAGDYSHILMKLYNGYDVVKGVIDVALNQFEKPVFTETKYTGAYFCNENTDWIRQIIENHDSDPDIVEAAFYNEDEASLGRIGYFIYQSEQKRRWGPTKY